MTRPAPCTSPFCPRTTPVLQYYQQRSRTGLLGNTKRGDKTGRKCNSERDSLCRGCWACAACGGDHVVALCLDCSRGGGEGARRREAGKRASSTSPRSAAVTGRLSSERLLADATTEPRRNHRGPAGVGELVKGAPNCAAHPRVPCRTRSGLSAPCSHRESGRSASTAVRLGAAATSPSVIAD